MVSLVHRSKSLPDMSVQHRATRHNEVTEQVLDVQRAFKKSVCYGQLLADASCTVIAV